MRRKDNEKQMKTIKYLKLVAALLVMNGIMCACVAYASDYKYDGTYYSDDSGNWSFVIPNCDSYGRALSDEIRIHKWHGESGSCIIPSIITLKRWDVYSNPEDLSDNEKRQNGAKTFSIIGIDASAFAGCKTLINLTIQGNPSIGSSPFTACTSLTSVSMPNITSINWGMFYGCSALTDVFIPNVTRIDGPPDEVPVLIAGTAFRDCTSLVSISLPNVTSIGGGAFRDCTSLVNVSIPKATSIGEGVFYGCVSLVNITIPNGCTNVGDSAFYNCTSLESVKMPSSVTAIGPNAFFGCSAIKEVLASQFVMGRELFVTFPSGYSSIQHLVMDEAVSSIAVNAFRGCKSLTNIEVDAANEYYFVSPIDGCLYDREQTTLLCCPRNATTIIIPYGVAKIGNYAFADCSNLVSVTLPVTLKEIGEYAFLDCVNLPTVSIPEGVTSIGNYAFGNCRKLSGITIPLGVQALSTTAFENCDILWTDWYRALADFAVYGRAYDLTQQVKDRAIADVIVSNDVALDNYVLKDGKVYDSILYVHNNSENEVRVSLPSGDGNMSFHYKAFKGSNPLTLPAYSTSILTITRVAGTSVGGNIFLVAREELESVQ